MLFDEAKWNQLCTIHLESLRSGEVDEFRHMRSHFEVLCRKMLDHASMQQQQPSARQFFAPAYQGPSGFGQMRLGGNENEFAAKRVRFNGPSGGQGGSKGAKNGGSKGANGGKKAQPSAVVPDKIRAFTNSEVHMTGILRSRPNLQWTTLETAEQLKVALDDIAEKVPMLFVVWNGAFEAEGLQELKGLCEAKATFFRLITQDNDEDGNFLEHIVMPEGGEMPVTGRALLKEAQDAGLKPTSFPLV